jgi:hypothetical protein
MVSPAVEKSAGEVSSRAIRNLSHGLAQGDCRRCADDRRRAYVMDNHGGADAPRSCIARMRVCWGFAVSAARALPNHGGLRPPLLAVHAFVHRESRHFADTRSRLQTGAAGVSPPWCTETRLQGRYRKHAGNCRRWAGERYCNRGHRGSVGSVPSNRAVALRMRFGEPRGAYAPRSWLSVACR